MRSVITIILFGVIVCMQSCNNHGDLGQWNINYNTTSKDSLAWAPFTWTNEELGGKYFERTAMFIPAAIEGLPYSFQFQFDLGSNLTVLDGNPLEAIAAKYREFKGANKDIINNLVLKFGDIKATAHSCYVQQGYGEELSAGDLVDSIPVQLGSIGADLFQNKILVIDYPHRRFAVCDALPASMRPVFTPIQLDKHGRVILPMQLGNKEYRVLFDNGSSLFPLLVAADKIDLFPLLQALTLSLYPHGAGSIRLSGRPLTGPFRLGGQVIQAAFVYADYRDDAATGDYDAITGNALFWNQMVILDFKHKRFGVL